MPPSLVECVPRGEKTEQRVFLYRQSLSQSVTALEHRAPGSEFRPAVAPGQHVGRRSVGRRPTLRRIDGARPQHRVEAWHNVRGERWSWRRDRRSRPVAGRAMPHTTMGQRGIPYRPGRVFTISRLRRGTIAGWLCTTTTASSGPALRTRYHMPKLSGPGTSTTKRAHRSPGGDDPSPCPPPTLTARLSPNVRCTARSARSMVPGRRTIGKTGLTATVRRRADTRPLPGGPPWTRRLWRPVQPTPRSSRTATPRRSRTRRPRPATPLCPARPQNAPCLSGCRARHRSHT